MLPTKTGELAIEKTRVRGDLIRKLEKVLNRGIETDALTVRLYLNKFFNIVRDNTRAKMQEKTKAVRFIQVVEAQRGNATRIWSLRGRDECMLHKLKQICAEFQ